MVFLLFFANFHENLKVRDFPDYWLI
jgi:hypothetical protein